MLHTPPLGPQLYTPYHWTTFTVLPLLVTYGDSARCSEIRRSAASPDAGLTVMEAPHDRIRVESNQDGLDDLCLLQVAEDIHD